MAQDEHGETAVGAVWDFVTGEAPNQPPNQPANPFPADGSLDQSLDVTLSWTSIDPDGDVVTFDVYFEANDTTPDVLVSDDQTDASYALSQLNANTHYYWQIVAQDEHGETAVGAVWDFVTGEAPNQPPNQPANPFPADGSLDQSLDVTLSWTSIDPDGDVVTFDVYFEANDTTPDVLVSDDQTNASYALSQLNANTHYYWQIVAQDEHGETTVGAVWDFVTGNYDPPPSNMVLVPAGEFQMGCDQNFISSCELNELPLHVTYLDAFYIDKYEVTNLQYSACVTAGDCTPPSSDSSYTRESYYSNSSFAHYPVLFLNWYQATAYCTWSEKRLPTEAEWEKAARGSNDTRKFPWGNLTADCNKANFAVTGSTGYCVGDTSPVGNYLSGSSPYGVLDMAGNVLEWVSDWYQSDYYNISPYINPKGPNTGTTKVMRGGSWNLGVESLQVFDRVTDFPGYHGPSVGFRCALDES